jgi:hypothetical protein
MKKPSTGTLVLVLACVSLLVPAVRGFAALPAPGATSGAAMVPSPVVPGVPNAAQQIAALQSQVNALQAQVAALTSAIQVTQQGLVLRGPSIQIVSQADLRVTVGGEIDLKSSGNTLIQSSGIMGIRGALVQFNGGNKQVATVGSLVAPTNPTNPAPTQVLNGTPTLLTN